MQKASASSARLKLLNAAVALFRERGYTDTTVDDLCRAAGVTKGSFFHYFSSKEALALAAIQHWNDVTGELFAGASYHAVNDPRERLFAYLDFRAQLVRGEAPEFTCLLGTLVQETFLTHPAMRAACGEGIEIHARTLEPTVEAAKARYAPDAEWSAADLARHTQAVLQGAFVLAKAMNNPQIVLDEIAHLRRYVEHLLPTPREREQTMAGAPPSAL